MDALRDLITKIKRALNGGEVRLSENQKAAFADLSGKVSEMEKLFTKALETTQEKAGSKNAANEGGKAKYSINPSFERTVKRWFSNGQNAGESFTLGTTGDTLQGLGAIESDIYMNGDKISKILKDHPEMTIDEIGKIPEILEDPVLILKSKGNGSSNNSRMVIFGTIKAQNGQPVMSVLDLRPRENGFLLDDMQKVNSSYTKSNPGNFVSSGEVLYADKKRTASLLGQFGLTIASRELLQSGSIGSITYNGDKVNMSGVPFSDVVSVAPKFSLKSPVEETNDLLALHNAKESDIFSALKLGGLPMPSIAVVKAEAGLSKYGPISLVFNKSTIDPQTDSRNKVYGSDAYTPTAPQVDYRVNDKRMSEIEREIHTLAGNTAIANGIFGNSAALRSMGINDVSTKDTAKIAQELSHTDTVRAVADPDAVGRYGDSDFLRAVEGKEPADAWAVVDELMDTLRVVNQRVYNSIMRKLQAL